MSYSKNRAIVLAVTEGAMTTSQAATHFNTSPRHIRRLLTQYRQHGLKGLEPKSRKPHHNPNATNQQTINQIIKLRHKLQNEGLDNGPQSIWNHLPNDNRPSPTTIWRIEAYCVLFRFLYGGQLTDPVLIIACDNLLWGSVA